MCLTLTGKIIEICGKNAMVDFNGVKRKVNVEFVKAKEGNSVIVFNGYALEILKK
jgi:hydrogenase expression/formation protein HypC